ncbi:MAG: hypothetical protein IJU39_04360, partial [Clostridia bacterium]|nr:hypothetical protein [Clostridia bacterium]
MQKMKKILSLMLVLCFMASTLVITSVTSFAAAEGSDTDTLSISCSPNTVTTNRCRKNASTSVIIRGLNNGSLWRAVVVRVKDSTSGTIVYPETQIWEGKYEGTSTSTHPVTFDTSSWSAGDYEVQVQVLWSGRWQEWWGGWTEGGNTWSLFHSYCTITVEDGGHTIVEDAAVEATCTSTGLTAGSHCSACNAVIVAQETVPVTAHSYESSVTTPATCIATGVMTYTCSVCGDSYTDTIPTTSHTYNTVVTSPTCTEQGYTTYTCSVCGDSYVDNYFEATGHNWGEGVVTTSPTCTENGVRTYTCANCGDTYTEAVSATGHTVVEDAAVAATCTEAGHTAGTHCSVCGAVLSGNEAIPATGHDYEAVVTNPTCTEAGYTTYTCANCGDTYTDDATEALGHNYETEVTSPTCTTAGYTTYTCANCGDTYTDGEVPATGHTVVEDAAVPATCTETGLTAGSHCSVCDAILVAQEVVPATGHSFDEGEITTAPDCTTAGVKTYTCTECGATDTEVVPATGHTPGTRAVETVENVEKYVTRCTVCDAVISVEDIDSADYTAVNAAIAAAEALTVTEYYDFSAVTAAVAAVETGLNAEHQEDVDAMATAITEAIDALEPLSDYFKLVDGTVATLEGTTITLTAENGAETIGILGRLKETT